MSGDRYFSGFGGVLELAMTSALGDQKPPILFH
jgi:hypothetical protein